MPPDSHATGTRVAWEHAWLSEENIPVTTHDLKTYGENGWELVSVIWIPDYNGREFFFKREKS